MVMVIVLESSTLDEHCRLHNECVDANSKCIGARCRCKWGFTVNEDGKCVGKSSITIKVDALNDCLFYSALIPPTAGENSPAKDFTFPIRSRVLYRPMTINMG